MDDHPFLALIRKYDGFEFEIGFRKDVDHWIGGTGNTVWYLIEQGGTEECRIGEWDGTAWHDRLLVLKRKKLTEQRAEPGTTIAMIEERAYFKQAEIAADGRRPAAVTLSGHACSHYAFSFGARAYDILDEFGITAAYSNIDDEEAGYRLRNVFTGENVRPPKLS